LWGRITLPARKITAKLLPGQKRKGKIALPARVCRAAARTAQKRDGKIRLFFLF